MAWVELKPVKPGVHTGAAMRIVAKGKTPRLKVKLGPAVVPNAYRGG